MIIKKEITRLQHPFPAKGSSYTFNKYQDLLKDSAPLSSPKVITRTDSMIMQKSTVRRNNVRQMMVARRRRASKEIVRRALTPPARRLTWRWFDFRPTPSRLSVMSMAI
ncbi:hypothetical protein Tco_1008674 [Tanacetum coccineum]